jgi:hypothetical protein
VVWAVWCDSSTLFAICADMWSPRSMAREFYPLKKVVSFDRRMMAAINKWRRRQEAMPSGNAAIRALIARGLAASKSACGP